MKAALLILLIPAVQICLAQSTQDTIHWRSNYKLKWADFKGIPDTNSIGGAATISGFSTRSSYTSDTSICVIVSAVFYRMDSWVKKKWKSVAALNHEQGHFDISEVYSRKVNRAFQTYKYNAKTVSEDIDSILNSYFNEMTRVEKLYDKETTYPIKPIKQKDWNKKIAYWLKSM